MSSCSSAPKKFHPSLVRMNELYQSGIIRDEHLIMQEIGAFSSEFGLIYDDPIRSMKDMNKKFPTLTFVSECMRESITGKQAYNCYLGKHNVGQGTKGLLRGSKVLDDVKRFNHVEPSNSSFKKKAAAPIVSNGVIVNYILIMLRMCAKLTDVKVFGPHYLVLFCEIILIRTPCHQVVPDMVTRSMASSQLLLLKLQRTYVIGDIRRC